jgi:hypothetical protein
VRFNVVGSGRKSNESRILTGDFNGVIMDLMVSFTTLPQGMDLILGLDSKLSRVDLDRNEATIDGNSVTIAGKNLGRIFPDQSIFQVSQEELGLVENELELEDEQEDAKVQENPHKFIQDVLDSMLMFLLLRIGQRYLLCRLLRLISQRMLFLFFVLSSNNLKKMKR